MERGFDPRNKYAIMRKEVQFGFFSERKSTKFSAKEEFMHAYCCELKHYDMRSQHNFMAT